MSEAFHDDTSTTPNPCGHSWQMHCLSHQSGETCRGNDNKWIRGSGGEPLLDENGQIKVEPSCPCNAIAPRHFQFLTPFKDVWCNCGWDPMTAKEGETWDTHDDQKWYFGKK